MSSLESKFSDKPSVCVVIVTYGDRGVLLAEVLKGIVAQTYKVSCVVIVNNGASYSIEDVLVQCGVDARLVSFESNKGSAEGYAAGICAALSTKMDLLWLLDDDNKPETNALEKSVKLYQATKDAVLCTRLTPGVGRRISGRTTINGFLGFNLLDDAFRMWLRFSHRFFGCGSRELNDNSAGGKTSTEVVDVAPYGGLLIPASLVQRMGLPRTDFVTYADDTEWTSRIVHAGGTIRRCRDALVIDLENSWHLRSGPLKPLVSPDVGFYRMYYGVRNQTYLEFRAASNKFLFFLNVAIRTSVLFFNLMLFSSDKSASLQRFQIFMKAIADGVRGRLGHRPEYENDR
ncbi:Glycosyltransferase, GT2 family [Desulfacinum hydrothermale DSM 13146]|uniref:Glycosyltransferase, GT2 family n=2 Tax=Desulfacinum hydrothermale TaxID=109258 RepID=A0A1W1XEU7_9BACT|nr:glycosyltransferase [Desulfacinum hydrothermale]SMC22449.1 Glycosyltransferase, GT2 family [Desulfacinum hydrothermale DSM 13146]